MPYPQQQQPGPFRSLDELEQRAHPAIGYVCGAVFAVGGFFYGLDRPQIPLVLPIGLGLIGGLLIVALLKHTTEFLIYTAMVLAAGFGTFYLFEHTDELRARRAIPAAQTAPASRPHGLLDDLGVR